MPKGPKDFGTASPEELLSDLSQIVQPEEPKEIKLACGICKYYQDPHASADGMRELGSCNRFPPNPTAFRTQTTPSFNTELEGGDHDMTEIVQVTSLWPEVHPEVDWCGEFVKVDSEKLNG